MKIVTNIITSLASLAAAATLLCGCAGVRFYSDKKLKHETGLTYYPPKPYLLVARKAKDQIDIQVLYLPDTKRPQYLKYSKGLGTHEFSVGLANGILTSYGQKTDTKIPELIAAVTGLLGEGVKTAEKAGTFAVQGAKDFTAFSKEVEGTATNLAEQIKNNQLTPAEKAQDKVDLIVSDLDQASKLLNAPVPDSKTILELLKRSKDALAILEKKSPDRLKPESPVAKYNDALAIAGKRIGDVVDQLSEKPPALAFDLYEIVQDGSKTKLIKCEP